MAVNVTTDHQVFPFGDNTMALFDSATGAQLVSATRENIGAPWTIRAEGADDVTTLVRAEAITALIDHALSVLPGSGYTCLVPTGLGDLP